MSVHLYVRLKFILMKSLRAAQNDFKVCTTLHLSFKVRRFFNNVKHAYCLIINYFDVAISTILHFVDETMI